MGAIWPRPQTRCYAIMSSQTTYAALSLDSLKPTEEAGKRNGTRQARRTMSKVREIQEPLWVAQARPQVAILGMEWSPEMLLWPRSKRVLIVTMEWRHSDTFRSIYKPLSPYKLPGGVSDRFQSVLCAWPS